MNKPPSHFKSSHKRKWLEIVAKLEDVGSFNKVDSDLIESYVVAYFRYIEAQKMLAAEGEVLISPKTGCSYPNPWQSVLASSWNQMAKLSTLFGLDPKSRKKLGLDTPGFIIDDADNLRDDD